MMNLSRMISRIKNRLENTRDLYMGRLSINKATLGAIVIRKDGTQEDLGIIARKKVTNAFVADLVAALAANAGPYGTFDDYKFHDCGTGTTAEANTQTALVTPYGGARISGSQNDGGAGATVTYQSVGTVSFTSSLAITEHGLFNASTSGTMMDRSVFAAINVDDGDSIQFTYTLTVNSEA
jgi:hypothetical protein